MLSLWHLSPGKIEINLSELKTSLFSQIPSNRKAQSNPTGFHFNECNERQSNFRYRCSLSMMDFMLFVCISHSFFFYTFNCPLKQAMTFPPPTLVSLFLSCQTQKGHFWHHSHPLASKKILSQKKYREYTERENKFFFQLNVKCWAVIDVYTGRYMWKKILSVTFKEKQKWQKFYLIEFPLE